MCLFGIPLQRISFLFTEASCLHQLIPAGNALSSAHMDFVMTWTVMLSDKDTEVCMLSTVPTIIDFSLNDVGVSRKHNIRMYLCSRDDAALRKRFMRKRFGIMSKVLSQSCCDE
ncbi:hypothetical protein RvY_13914-2 [Ramazzottius varieornatus]|uniref:Uncharacterized protein n=1 Tax=Ramazzottius varieornatus TaxID=947166 RepID=A0A1D1VTH1_RAMVA|nr:hypothetical protein RvY_13914-2 [Ramazzottius varieornatus]